MGPVVRTVLRCLLLAIFGAPAVVLSGLAVANVGSLGHGHFSGADIVRPYLVLAAFGATVSAPASLAGVLALFSINGLKRKPWSRRQWTLCAATTGGLLGLLAAALGPWPLGLANASLDLELTLLATTTGLAVGGGAGALNAADLESMHGTHAA